MTFFRQLKDRITCCFHQERQPSNWAQISGAFAAFVAVVLAAGTYYSARSQKTAELAIEMSKQLLSEPELRKGYVLLLKDIQEGTERNLSDWTNRSDDILAERSFVDLLDYVAKLAIGGRIDNNFLSWRVKCDIYFVENTADQKLHLPNIADLKEYVSRNLQADCPEQAPRNK